MQDDWMSGWRACRLETSWLEADKLTDWLAGAGNLGLLNEGLQAED